MTGTELISFSNYLIGEEHFDVTSADDLIFLNIKKDAIELDMDWEFLKTQATLTGDDLPTDFLKPLARNSLFIGFVPYEQVALADNQLNSGLTYYINYTTNKIYLVDGASLSGAILNYIKKTSDLTASTSPVWPKCHELISYDLAIEYLDSLDFDEINMAKAQRLSAKREKIWNGLVDLNSRLALASMNYQMSNGTVGVNDLNKINIYA